MPCFPVKKKKNHIYICHIYKTQEEIDEKQTNNKNQTELNTSFQIEVLGQSYLLRIICFYIEPNE